MAEAGRGERRRRLSTRPVITGIGPIASSGVGNEEFWGGLLEAPEGPAPLHDPSREGIPSPPFPLRRPSRERVAAVLARRGLADLPDDPELRLAAAAAALAFEDARIEGAGSDVGLVMTWEAPGMERLLRALWSRLGSASPADFGGPPQEVLRSFYEGLHEPVYASQSFIHLHVLAKAFGIHGPTLFVNNACASGLYALDTAAELIESGKARVVVVIAAESPLFPGKHLWFAGAGLASRDGWLRPFDRDRSGLVLAEAAAALVVEPLEAALSRDARAHGEYLGGGFNQEGWKVTIPDFSRPWHEDVIREACARAGIEPGSIDAVVAHGAGTALSDAYEAKGITAVFGKRPVRPAVTSLKGHFGHALGASALLETAALLLGLGKDTLPGTAGFRAEDPKLDLVPSSRPSSGRLSRVLKVANGFAGFNAAAIFERVAP